MNIYFKNGELVQNDIVALSQAGILTVQDVRLRNGGVITNQYGDTLIDEDGKHYNADGDLIIDEDGILYLDGVPVAGLVNKQYVEGTAYNNGTPLLTSAEAGFTVVRAVFVPYQTSNGAWRLRGNGQVSVTSATTFQISLSGITFNSGHDQVGTLYGGASLSSRIVLLIGSGDMTLDTGSAASNFIFAFDAELDDKPTWAD